MSASKRLLRFFVALICMTIAAVAAAANLTWVGGNNDWDSTASRWSGNDEPDFDDVAIFNTSNSVDLAIASQTILGLTMSGGIGLSTNGNDLTVNGTVELSGASTDLTVGGAGSLLTADAITINSGADITLTGGQITVVEETGSGLLDVNDGGELSGNGTIQFTNAVAAGTQLFNLDGTLTAHSTAALDLQSLVAATLTINIVDGDGVIDLDGNDGVSTINVLRNDTLVLNGGVFDSNYSGTINLSAGATFSRNVAWRLNGTLNANTGGGAAATIAGAEFRQTNGSINIDSGETLRLSSEFRADNGTINNNGTIIFNNAAQIDAIASFQLGSQSSIEVNNGEVLVIGNWDWDGDGGLDNIITINDSGALSSYQTSGDWGGAMYINGGNLDVLSGIIGNLWRQSSGLINIGGSSTSRMGGSLGVVFSKTGGAFNVEPLAVLDMNCESAWSGGALNVDGRLALFGAVTWEGGIAVTGNGIIHSNAASVVAANTTLTINTFDWDGLFLVQENVHSINSGVTFTLNISDFDADDADMDDPINLGGNGAQLIINSPLSWIMDDVFTANTTDVGTATIGGTSRMILKGILDVNGSTTVDAPITFDDGSETGIANFKVLRLSGGNLTNNPNRLSGGTITGVGLSTLRADAGSALHGWGLIENTLIDFDDSANLKADNGVLTITAGIIDVNVLGTADSDGVLNIPVAWNTAENIAFVEMQGGEIRGGAITNNNVNGIDGHGIITARVINNTRIDAVNGPLLRLQTVGSDNDWDGTTNTGSLNALSADLVIHDNATFPFLGTVSADNGRAVFVENFELEFEPGSTLSLANGAHYSSTHGTHIGGAVTVTGGTATLNIVGTTIFENSSATTLSGDLRLENTETVVEANATFAGGGSLINAADSKLRLMDGANLGVLIENHGTLELGASPGQVQGLDFQQDAGATLNIELAGTGLSDFDRLVLTDQAQLAGFLNVSLLDGFSPALGNVFGFLSAAGGVTGTFNTTNLPSLAAGLAWSVSYNPTTVQLSVVQVGIPGDYNNNGIVDAADYVLWRNDGPLANEIDTPGTVNNVDFTAWRSRFGNSGSAAGATANTAVPEPAPFVLLVLAAACWCSWSSRPHTKPSNSSVSSYWAQGPAVK
jgi:hypothetical protein